MVLAKVKLVTPTLNASESSRSDADSAFVKTAGKVTDGLALVGFGSKIILQLLNLNRIIRWLSS